MTDYLLRSAVEGDFRAVTTLLEELGRPRVLGTPDEALHHARFCSWLADPNSVALLAEQDRVIIGFLTLYVVPRLNVTRPQAWIPDLVVNERARGRGVGHALLERAEEVARGAGAFMLTLQSPPWRSQAHRLYSRFGMKDNAVQFEKMLVDLQWRASQDN